MPVAYTFTTTVLAVTEEKTKVHVSGTGPDWVHRVESLGWFVTLEGSYEKVCLGPERPDLKAGDRVKVTIQKV